MSVYWRDYRLTPGQASDIVRSAVETISDDRHWTTGANARDGEGQDIEPLDSTATCWCAYGAMIKAVAEKVALNDSSDAYYLANYILEPIIQAHSITDVNDSMGREAAITRLTETVAYYDSREVAA